MYSRPEPRSDFTGQANKSILHRFTLSRGGAVPQRRSVTLPPADVRAVSSDFRVGVDFDRSWETVSEPEAHLAKSLKTAAFA